MFAASPLLGNGFSARLTWRAGPGSAAGGEQQAGETDAGVDVELAIDALDMLADRMPAQAQLLGDLAVAVSIDDQGCDLALARREGGHGTRRFTAAEKV